MKKLKFLTLAAIAAATAMVSSCSDNDVLEGAKSKGVPLTVNATTTSNGSRSTDILSKDLTTFQLWGFGIDENRFDGDNFTKNGSVFKSATDHIYPGSDNYLFYGISNNTSTMAYGVPTGSPGINTSKADIVDDGGKFVYTIPTNVADQEDLLVAAAKGNATQGVTMHFDHALTAAKLHLVLDPSTTNYADDPEPYYFYAKIRKITIHNIKISGTYTFGAGTSVGASSSTTAENGSWDTSGGTSGDYVITLPSPILIQQLRGGVTDITVNVDGSNSNVYFIPQTVTKWDILPNKNGQDMTVPTDKSYVELEAMAGIYEPGKVAQYLRVLCGWTKIEETDPGAAAANGYYHNNVKVADLEGNIVDNTDETIEFYLNSYGYEPNQGDFESLVSTTVGWSKTADGFKYNNVLVAETDGKVIDFSNEAINDNSQFGAQPTMETYDYVDHPLDLLGTYSDLDNDVLYGILYKPFDAILNVNGNRNIKLRLDTAIKMDGSGAFGEGSTTEG